MDNFSEKEHAILRNCELLKEMSEKNFNAFISLSQKSSYAQGETILKEGDDSNYLFILLSGTVALYKSTHTGPSLVGTLSSGQSIGEIRVVKNRPCTLTVVASTPVDVLCIALTKLRNLDYYQCYESILDGIINVLSERLMSANLSAIKERKKRNYLWPLLVVVTSILFVCELSVVLYYAYNSF